MLFDSLYSLAIRVVIEFCKCQTIFSRQIRYLGTNIIIFVNRFQVGIISFKPIKSFNYKRSVI